MLLSEFQYPIEQDQKIFRDANIKLKSNFFTIQACTVSGSKDGKVRKPNEDAFSLLTLNQTLLAAVFDGSSSLKPIKSLKDQTGARFASHYLKNTLEKENENISIKKIIRSLNKKLLSRTLEFEGASLKDANTLPASTVTLVQVAPDQNAINISHVGDSFCIVLFADQHTEFITVDRNKKYDDEILQQMRKIAIEKHISPRDARKDEIIEQALIDMFQDSFNKPNGTGQGIIDGDPNVEQYIQDISIPLNSVSALFLGTDGIIPPGWNEQEPLDQKKIFETIQKRGLDKFIKIKLDTEDADPDFTHNVRYKHSDDATGIYIKLGF